MRVKAFEILDDFWHKLKWLITVLLWLGKFAIGALMIGYWDLKEIFEGRKRKGGVR